MKGLIGKKIGMTQVWDSQGRLVPVTVIEAGPCPVVQVKSLERDGYRAAQVGFGSQKEGRLSKALAARFRKAGVAPCRCVREFGLDADEEVAPGEALTVALFESVKFVDVSAIAKGRGFAGVVRRYRMAGGPMTHGGHSKRRVGSIGARDLPGWVEKGKRMPGHMGAKMRTARNLALIQVRKEDNLLLVRGAVPGATGSIMMIRKALKRG